MDAEPTPPPENPPPPSAGSSPSPSGPSPVSPEEAERILLDATRRTRKGREAVGRREADMHINRNMPLAPPYDPRREAAMAASAELKEKQGRALRLEQATVPRRYMSADFSLPAGMAPPERASFVDAVGALRNILYSGSLGGDIFLLLGPRGTGKTHLACALIRLWVEEDGTARYAEAGDYFLALDHAREKETRSALEVEREYLAPELLVLDAMEERADTPAKDRMLSRLINKRYAALRDTLLITNETEEQFMARAGDSIADRIRDGGGAIVCEWASLRGRV